MRRSGASSAVCRVTCRTRARGRCSRRCCVMFEQGRQAGEQATSLDELNVPYDLSIPDEEQWVFGWMYGFYSVRPVDQQRRLGDTLLTVNQ